MCPIVIGIEKKFSKKQKQCTIPQAQMQWNRELNLNIDLKIQN